MKQNTEQLKKIEEIRNDVANIIASNTYTHIDTDGGVEFKYICLIDNTREFLIKSLTDYITKTTPHLISSDEIKREAEPVLCYVEGDTAYFTTQLLSEQWGDDWNDVPYEANAGTPYGYQSKDEWNIYTLKFDWDSEQPKDGHYNSPYSVEDINSGKVPWLKPSKWVKGGKNIYAGTTMQDFARLIMSTGGRVYRQLYEGDYLYLTQSKEGGE